MELTATLRLLSCGLLLALSTPPAFGRPASANPTTPLTGDAAKLESRYAEMLASLKAEIEKSLPTVNPDHHAALQKARANVKKSQEAATAVEKELGFVNNAKALVLHAKNKWIAGADKGIAAAQEALKKAANAVEREAAQKELAKWEQNKKEGLEALKEREAAYEKARAAEPKLQRIHQAAQTALSQAKADESKAAQKLLAGLNGFLDSDNRDAILVKATVLTDATPRGLAEFAEKEPGGEALIDELLGDTALMKEMLTAGGAKFGKYGQAMKILAAIRKASPQSSDGALRRLALATSLEHAVPVALSMFKDRPNAPTTVDPLNRYLHYEKAFLAGELDPAFGHLDTWQYRHVVNNDAPDEIIAWGREMLRTYRPDHITLPDYGWRYVQAVRTDVAYGSQNVKDDLPSLHQFQNIMKNGGVCGRRAFYGRFILRSFGIPTWGVTQRAHAALSHWTPKGWVINLGAGFPNSWWDKDEVPLSGTQFLADTQARAHAAGYAQVLRAQWIGRILGEPAYNERARIEGGFWSSLGQLITADLATKAATLGPLGQELAEANDREQKVKSESVHSADRQVAIHGGVIQVPAVAHGDTTGKAAAMRSHCSGMQIHALAGFKTDYAFEAPTAGAYQLTFRVATVQDGQVFITSVNDGDVTETAVPYTIGLWRETPPIPVDLKKGNNVVHFELKPGSRGVTIKELILKPVE